MYNRASGIFLSQIFTGDVPAPDSSIRCAFLGSWIQKIILWSFSQDLSKGVLWNHGALMSGQRYQCKRNSGFTGRCRAAGWCVRPTVRISLIGCLFPHCLSSSFFAVVSAMPYRKPVVVSGQCLACDIQFLALITILISFCFWQFNASITVENLNWIRP